ncbi:MAG: hypothetical protein KDA96_09460 [Planctomycetaceae bacterium]|nr:hypothetical protein [Planctomycetaceae bacterium]
MNDSRNGRRFGIPRNRRLTWDLLAFNRHVPLCAHDRRMSLLPVSEARRNCNVRISWPTLFLRSYAIVAQSVPELRQSWHSWPIPHLYQNPDSVGIVTVHRDVDGSPWLFWGMIVTPENLSLVEIQQQIDTYQNGDVTRVFRRQWQLSLLPTVLRRLIWCWNLHFAARRRARRLGTFFLSTLAGRGVEIQLPPSIHTGCLTYGPLDQNGCARVTLGYDHRIMDGSLVADVLVKLESVLNDQIVSELAAIHANA